MKKILFILLIICLLPALCHAADRGVLHCEYWATKLGVPQLIGSKFTAVNYIKDYNTGGITYLRTAFDTGPQGMSNEDFATKCMTEVARRTCVDNKLDVITYLPYYITNNGPVSFLSISCNRFRANP